MENVIESNLQFETIFIWWILKLKMNYRSQLILAKLVLASSLCCYFQLYDIWLTKNDECTL